MALSQATPSTDKMPRQDASIHALPVFDPQEEEMVPLTALDNAIARKYLKSSGASALRNVVLVLLVVAVAVLLVRDFYRIPTKESDAKIAYLEAAKLESESCQTNAIALKNELGTLKFEHDQAKKESLEQEAKCDSLKKQIEQCNQATSKVAKQLEQNGLQTLLDHATIPTEITTIPQCPQCQCPTCPPLESCPKCPAAKSFPAISWQTASLHSKQPTLPLANITLEVQLHDGTSMVGSPSMAHFGADTLVGVANVSWEVVREIKVDKKVATIKLWDGTSLKCGLLEFYGQMMETAVGLVRMPDAEKLKNIGLEVRSGNIQILTSCSEAGSSGVYVLPNGIQIYCQENDGKMWTVFQRHHTADLDFYRGWDEYKVGFGNLQGDFWLGNDNLHRLVGSGSNTLRVLLEDMEGRETHADYSVFNVGDEASKYVLTVSGHSGNAMDGLGGMNGHKFSTKDRDNDGACAQKYHAAWWYTRCHDGNPNGIYYGGHHTSDADGTDWIDTTHLHYSYKTSLMFLSHLEPA